jgi:hypothetical protein
MGYTFVSYSRKQLYFAEAVALSLQRAGIEIWFDLQKLEPGIDWSQALAEGYGNCERLVFVASESALRSPYVQVEWETALKNGREVILVLCEPVSLPESLQGCAVYDARTRFDDTLQELVRYLKGQAPARHDPVPAPGGSLLLNKMPADIWLTTAVMLFPAVTAWAATFLYSFSTFKINVDLGLPDSFLPGVPSAEAFLLGIVAGLVLALTQFPIRDFLRHEVRAEELDKLRSKLVVTQVTACLLGFLFASSASSPLVAWFGYGNFLFPLLTLYWSFWTLKRSPDLLRWMPSGEADQEVRESIQGREARHMEQVPAAGRERGGALQEVRFAVHCHPADRGSAAYIEAILRARGCLPAAAEKADVHLILVSNRTSKSWLLEQDASLPGRQIHILITNIHTPPELQPVLSTQWVDFRNARRSIIQRLGDYLRSGSSVDLAMQFSPTGFNNAFGFPRQVRLIFGVIILLFIVTAIAVSEQYKTPNWVFIPASLPLLLYLYALIMRKISLPSFFAVVLKYNVAWFASPAPAAADPIGNDDWHYITDRNFLLLVDALEK